MRELKFTDKELDIIQSALRGRADRMFNDAMAYKKNGNTEALKDCLNEFRLAQNLNADITEKRNNNNGQGKDKKAPSVRSNAGS